MFTTLTQTGHPSRGGITAVTKGSLAVSSAVLRGLSRVNIWLDVALLLGDGGNWSVL